MTKSIFEKITLTAENEKELLIATSATYRLKVATSESIRKQRRISIRTREASTKIKQAFEQY